MELTQLDIWFGCRLDGNKDIVDYLMENLHRGSLVVNSPGVYLGLVAVKCFEIFGGTLYRFDPETSPRIKFAGYQVCGIETNELYDTAEAAGTNTDYYRGGFSRDRGVTKRATTPPRPQFQRMIDAEGSHIFTHNVQITPEQIDLVYKLINTLRQPVSTSDED